MPASRPAAEQRRAARDPRTGRYLEGHSSGAGGVVLPIRRLLGGDRVTHSQEVTIRDDARRLFDKSIAELPDDGAIVRQLLAMSCRHAALAAFWSVRASDMGVASSEGIEAAERTIRHDTRAERLMVTVLEVSTRLAGRNRRAAPRLDAIEAEAMAEAARDAAVAEEVSPGQNVSSGDNTEGVSDVAAHKT